MPAPGTVSRSCGTGRVRTEPVPAVGELEPATSSWVRAHADRLYSGLVHTTPVEHERLYHHPNTSRQHPLQGEPALY